MGRAIGGAVVGYIVFFALIFVGLTITWMALGADGAFLPGAFDLSMTWLIVSCVVGFLAALGGGRVARAIAKVATGPRILAGLIVVIGVGGAIAQMMAEPVTAAREAGLPMMEAIAQAQAPMWSLWVQPILGAIGALVGGKAMNAG